MTTEPQTTEIAKQSWVISKGHSKGMHVTVTLSVEYYSETAYEYVVRVHQTNLVSKGGRTERTQYDATEAFLSKKRGVEQYNFELSARGCIDYEAKRITY